ncbi:MAG: DNA repair protein RadC [Caldilineaceae bacterium]|nr:DNA repair protein RadC [Caldilineaceae bacterium]
MTQQPPLFGWTEQTASRRPLTLRELPQADHPATRLTYLGPGSLSLVELLTILIGGPDALDSAGRLLARTEGLNHLTHMTIPELTNMDGIGPSTAARLQAACELGRRMMVSMPQERPQLRTPGDVANLLMLEMGLLEQEQLRVILLDTKNFIQEVVLVYQGSLNMAMVRIGEIFRDAVRRNRASIVLVHNHPSGDPTPSPEDVRMTEMAIEAGKLLDIEVLDHIIIGRNRFVSLKERGLGFR